MMASKMQDNIKYNHPRKLLFREFKPNPTSLLEQDYENIVKIESN